MDREKEEVVVNSQIPDVSELVKGLDEMEKKIEELQQRLDELKKFRETLDRQEQIVSGIEKTFGDFLDYAHVSHWCLLANFRNDTRGWVLGNITFGLYVS